jgi:hypothetical protein
MHPNEPTIDDSDSVLLNKQLTLLRRLKWRLKTHEKLSRHQEEFLAACDAGANWYWEGKWVGRWTKRMTVEGRQSKGARQNSKGKETKAKSTGRGNLSYVFTVYKYRCKETFVVVPNLTLI